MCSILNHVGSIYELCGNECSLSTGDVIKVTGCKVKKVLAHLFTSNEYDMLPTMELPADFPGIKTQLFPFQRFLRLYPFVILLAEHFLCKPLATTFYLKCQCTLFTFGGL